MVRQISKISPWLLLAAAVSTVALSGNGADFYAGAAWVVALVWSFVNRRVPVAVPEHDAPSDRGRASSRIAASVVGGVVAAMWFSPDRFYAFGDRTPLVRDTASSSLFSPWNNLYSGGGNITWDVTRIAEVVFYQLGDFFGSPPLGQRFFTALVFAYAAYFAATLFSRIIRGVLLPALGGVLVAFSPLVMVTLPNYLHVIVSGAVCASITHFVDLRNGRKPGWYRLFVGTSPMFLVGTNPPLTVIVLSFVAASPLLSFVYSSQKISARRAAKHIVLNLLLHSWWIVPSFTASAFARSEETTDTLLDPSKWVWASAKSSISNLTTGAANWSWPRGEYFGSAVDAASPWFSWALWIVPLLFFMSFTDRFNGGRLSRLSILVCFPALIVAKGMHQPFGGFNAWLYDNLPGFWLLRQPTSKIWWILWIMVVGVALKTLQTLSGKLKTSKPGIRTASLALLSLLVLPIWPLVTGASAVGSPRENWPSHRVSLPDDWYVIGEHMKKEEGATISLPLADFYMMPTTWGFYGWDNIARNTIESPVFSLTDESYIGNPPALSGILRQYERSLLARDADALMSLGRDLGLGTVLVRKDYDQKSAVREVRIKDYRDIERSLAALGAERTFNGDYVSVWRLPWPVYNGYTTKSYVYVSSDLSTYDTAVVAASSGDVTIVPTADDGLGPRAEVGKDVMDISEPFSLKRTGDKTVYSIQSNADGLSLVEATTLYTPDGVAPKREFKLPSGYGVRIDGVWYSPGSKVGLPLGNTRIESVSLDANNTTVGGISPLADCNKVDNAPPSDTGLYVKEQGDYLELGAKSHSACVFWPSTLEAGVEYLVELEAESISGRPPRWCVQQEIDGKAGCAPLHSTHTDGRVYTVSTIIQGRRNANIKIFSYADGYSFSKDAQTRVRYKVPSVRRVVSSVLSDVNILPISDTVSSGKLSVSLEGPAAKTSPFSPPASCGGRSTIGTSGKETGTGVDLGVVSGEACVSSEITGAIAGGTVRVSASVVGTKGAIVSGCILGRGEKACSKESLELTGSQDVLNFETEILAGSFTNVLFLYVKSNGVPVEASFSDVSIRNVPPESLVGVPLSAYAGKPSVSESSSVLRAQSPGRHLFSAPTSYSRSWSADGRHVKSGGWSNGWILDVGEDGYELSPGNRASFYLRIFFVLYLFAALAVIFNRYRDYRFEKKVKSNGALSVNEQLEN